MVSAGRLARAAVLAAGATGVAHVLPSATWLPPFRRDRLPCLDGAGSPTSVALTFDDGYRDTLTDALPEADRDGWHRRLAAVYAASGPEPVRIDAICLLTQDGSEPFRLLARLPFGESHG